MWDRFLPSLLLTLLIGSGCGGAGNKPSDYQPLDDTANYNWDNYSFGKDGGSGDLRDSTGTFRDSVDREGGGLRDSFPRPDRINPDLDAKAEDYFEIPSWDDLPSCGDGCPLGSWCNEGLCHPCKSDEHCGAGCVNCELFDRFCKADGSSCVECSDSRPCEAGKYCSGDNCHDCNVDFACGADCLGCSGETPLCAVDHCVCSPVSCPEGFFCDGSVCTRCGSVSNPDHCGPDCLVCSGTNKPICKGNICACDETSCGSNHRCEDGECVLCDTEDSCGPDCQPCGGNKPFCAEDGHACVQCLSNDDCGEGAPFCHLPTLTCAECAQDWDCPTGDRCSVSGQCVPDCYALGCVNDLAGDGEECGSAEIVGRQDAEIGVVLQGDTTDDWDNDDLPSSYGNCWDAGDDNFFRIYLMPGDVLTVFLDPQQSVFDASFKFWKGIECKGGATWETDLVYCTHTPNSGSNFSYTYSAAQEGWYTFVVDGKRGFDEDHDWGPYTIQFNLTCHDEGCCCY